MKYPRAAAALAAHRGLLRDEPLTRANLVREAQNLERIAEQERQAPNSVSRGAVITDFTNWSRDAWAAALGLYIEELEA